MMRRSIACVLLIAGLGTGCSVSINSSKPAAEHSTSIASSGVGSPSARESMFPGYVKEKILPMEVLSDKDVVGFGKQVCTDLDKLQPTNSLVMGSYIAGYIKGVKGALTEDQSVAFVGYSIAAFCPEYEDVMQQ